MIAQNVFKAVILGAPGSGKGTISSRIVKKFQLNHISSGDKLRLHINNKTEIGQQVKQYINNGQLVPDDFIVKFILNELRSMRNSSWLLDGFPRTILQSEKLWQSEKVNVVLNLNVPFDIIIDRVKNRYVHLPSGRVYNIGYNSPKVTGKDDITGEDLVQREDDKPEFVKKRLQIYEEITKPVIEFYRRKGILKEFEGETSNEIWPKVEKCLQEFFTGDEKDMIRISNS